MPSATAKRSRHIAFDDASDDEAGSAGEVGSSPRDGQRKKTRVSKDARRDSSTRSRRQQSEASSSDVDSDAEEARPAPDLPLASQFEYERDLNFEHLQHAEDDDMRATQRLKNRPELIGDNHAALNAVIEQIEIINFMCHERLIIQLGPLLNFIVGRNGSGKSAILTAITLCLGGKASSTNRGASLKSFIREGQSMGRLTVSIKNQGPDAYKHDLFGDSIIVERVFRDNGTSGFKLKSAAGRIISTKREAVQDIVDYYCLQVDNPLNVLSQDNARQFLNSATPAQKYNYFLQGTQLEQLSNDLELIHEHIDATEAKLSGFDENFRAIKADMEKYKKLKEIATKNDTLRHQQKLYVKQLAWAQVVEQEVILQEKENNIVMADEDIRKLQVEIQAKAAELEQHDLRIASTREDAEHLRQDEAQLQTKKEEAKDAFDEAKKAVQHIHAQERDAHSQLQNANNDVKECTRKIREEETRLEDANGGAQNQAREALEQAKEAAKAAERAREEHNGRRQPLEEAFEAAERQAQDAAKPIVEKKKEVSEAEKHIMNLQQSRTDPLSGFHPKTRQLLSHIEKDNGFSQKPIGPLGLHVQLLKPKWSSILESTLGQILDAFLVSNQQDRLRLISLMKQLGYRQPTIYISDPSKLIQQLNEPDEQYDTVLRVLKFDDKQVRNQLIMVNQIENIVLIENLQDAHRVMGEGQAPRHAKLSISFHPVKKGHGVTIKPGPHGNLSQEPVEAVHKRRIQSDSEGQTNHQKQILTQLKLELRELEGTGRDLQQRAKKCSEAVTRHKREEVRLKTVIREAEVHVMAAEAAFDAYDGTDMRLDGLREELRTAEANEKQYGQQYGELALEKKELNKKAAAAKANLEEAHSNLSSFDERIKKIDDKITRLESVRSITLSCKNTAHEKLDLAKIKKEDTIKSRDKQQRQVETYIQGASDVCPERVFIPEGETYQSIEQKFSAIREQLAKFRDRHGMNEQQINEKAAQTYELYNMARRSRHECQLDLKASKDALSKRLDKWRMFQRMISASARTNFSYLLSERSFRGRLLLDHLNKKLAIEVEPDQTREDVSGRNTKTLSGGEKSFSSICLLLAIWEAMGSPLRCLDEFDVFMDVVNRKVAAEMLVSAARRSVGKQFILITPNIIETRADFGKDVKIIQ
ncbi:RecF/RecN/SMC N terminal domain-containing protein [Pestalotiopsis sp. NC0098]|nr:RecF/RecN/SMC N terminal domain-containing protein [Pestalotiopsis sp. NC0098]